MIFGLDFGTTNSLVALVQDGQVIRFLDADEPHPSVVWYRSGEETVVGRVAKENLGSRQSGVIGNLCGHQSSISERVIQCMSPAGILPPAISCQKS